VTVYVLLFKLVYLPEMKCLIDRVIDYFANVKHFQVHVCFCMLSCLIVTQNASVLCRMKANYFMYLFAFLCVGEYSIPQVPLELIAPRDL